MSKGDGQKIVIKFTQEIVGDVSGLSPAPIGGLMSVSPSGSPIGSSYYSGYPMSNAFDGSTSSYWRATNTTSQYIGITLVAPAYVAGFSWYVSSYAPKDFILVGKNLLGEWEVLINSISLNTSGWKEFTCTPGWYTELKWNILSAYSTRIYVYEIKLLIGAGNEKAFAITGKEPMYIGGPVVNGTYVVNSVSAPPLPILWDMTEAVALDYSQTAITERLYQTPGLTVDNTGSTSYEMGWAFKVGAESLNVTKLLICPQTSATRTVKLWSASGQLLRSVTIATVANEYTEIDITPIDLSPNTEYTLSANFMSGSYKYDNNTASAVFSNKITFLGGRFTTTVGSFPTTNGTTLYGIVDVLIGAQEYDAAKVVEYNIVADGKSCIRWTAEEPAGTNIQVQYITGTSEVWTDVINGEEILLDTQSTIRVTLSTVDLALTPTLQRIWLENLDARQDTLLLTLFKEARFHNALGDIVVSYDATKGNLQGRGGPVESFEVPFLPTELIPKNNPIALETLTTTVGSLATPHRITWHDGRADDEHLSMSTDITVTFTNVGVINP